MGSAGARRRLMVFEDPQCTYCREFEDASGDLLRREVAAGREMFANQPPEHSGGVSTEDVLDLGSRAGLTSPDYVTAVQEGCYESWVRKIDEVFEDQDPDGTPSAVLDGRPVDSETLYDPDGLGTLIRD